LQSPKSCIRKDYSVLNIFTGRGKRKQLYYCTDLVGAKENYYEACKSDALAAHTLIFFDNPGTGNSTYYDDFLLNVDDLAAIVRYLLSNLPLQTMLNNQ